MLAKMRRKKVPVFCRILLCNTNGSCYSPIRKGKIELEDLRLLLSRSSRTASRHYRAQLAQYDLSASQATALLYVNRRQGSTLRDLAEALSSDLATASALVERLVSQGLLRRETDPDDRRRARLLLTDAASALVESQSQRRRIRPTSSSSKPSARKTPPPSQSSCASSWTA